VSTEIYIPQVPESQLLGRPFPLREPLHWPNPAEIRALQSQQPPRTYSVSPWCASVWKRIFDLACVTPALLLIAPLLTIVAIAVRLTSKGPIIFRQQRSGRRGEPFTIYKFRTMIENSERLGPEHTAKDDPRITSIGNFLRRWKLDELPQLFNVLRGEMSLVGPRPKLPNHDHCAIACRPGITGAATLAFRNEQAILSNVPSGQIEAFYQNYVAPRKLKLDSEYMASATLLSDLDLLVATLMRAGQRLAHHDLCLSSTRSSDRSRPHSAIAFHAN
jgi:lipopolysaccharide/colanic/teichoic acid biosynthesis glycosyltransferase